MMYKWHKSFPAALIAMKKKGGQFAKSAEQLEALLYRIRAGDEDPLHGMRLTKHGESRIRHCIKYDLPGFSRLVTVQTDGYVILLYCGDHEECDRWIAERRGLDFAVDDKMRVVETYHSVGDSEDQRVGGTPGLFAKPLFERLPEALYEKLMASVPRRVARDLERTESTTTESELWEIVARIDEDERRRAVYDVFAQLRAERIQPAISRIKEFLGEVTRLDEVPSQLLPEVVDGQVLRTIDPKSPQFDEALKRFFRTATYKDWMLFMHPDQERIVGEDFDGPAKLVGVSGSGKTCVVIRRAVRLAESYPGERILILTLNPALAKLIDELVTACASDDARARIAVKPFFVLCQELMLRFNPSGARIYREVTWKSNEHVDEIWQEFYRCETNNYDARVLQPVHDSLMSRGLNAERYLREEIDWLRSALFPDARDRYLKIARAGRKVVLPTAFREAVLKGTAGWEDKMRVVGVTDALGLAQELAAELQYLRPSYRCVLVDEVQDFGNVELEIVRALVPPGANDLFLCGDAAQAVTTKYQRLKDVGIQIPGARSRKLTQNYRNSSDVLGAAYEVQSNNLSDELLYREDLEVLDPEFSAFSGNTPLMLQAPNLATELRGAMALGREKVSSSPDAKACIAICGYSIYELARFGERLNLPVLDGTRSLDSGSLFLSDLAQTKGFEFDLMCIVNCADGVLPDRAAPEEERERDLAMLYVAMTRAKTDLVLSWSGAPSRFLKGAEDKFYQSLWSEYLTDLERQPAVAVPKHVDDYRDGLHRKPWRDMTGEEFLYSPYAIGISLELVEKLRGLVDGRGLKKGSESVKWRRLGEAVDSYRANPRARVLWGPEVGRQLLSLTERLPASAGTADTVQRAPDQHAQT